MMKKLIQKIKSAFKLKQPHKPHCGHIMLFLSSQGYFQANTYLEGVFFLSVVWNKCKNGNMYQSIDLSHYVCQYCPKCGVKIPDEKLEKIKEFIPY